MMFPSPESENVRERNRGCYESPHSGVGMEFDPLEVATTGRRVVLHECGFLKELDWWIFPNQVSPFWRLYYNFVPGHAVVFGGEAIALAPDRLVLIPEGNSFDSRGEVPVTHFWMTFSVGVAANAPGPIVLPAAKNRIEEIKRIADGFEGVGKGDRFAIYHRSMALLHDLLVEIHGAHLLPGAKSEPLARAIDYMRLNFAKPIQIEKLAKSVAMSQRSLSQHFLKEYHCSPGQFLAKLRVGEAASLLVRTNLGIDEIAESVGYSDRYYLSRVFKRETGKSPAQYRRASRREPLG